MPQTRYGVCPTCHKQGKEHTLHATNMFIDHTAEFVYSQVPAMLLLIPAFTHAGDSCLARETMHETNTGGACGVDVRRAGHRPVVQTVSTSAAN